MHSLAERVLGHIRRQELLRAGDRVGVAVSGGIDSVALLRLLLELRGELGIVLSVVHFNHKLRGAESDADEQFVAGLAREHDLEFHVDSDDVAGQAREEGVSVETAARELRYGFFRRLVGKDAAEFPRLAKEARRGAPHEGLFAGLDKIATGHTLDDQAETVLMRMIRGAGMRGLGGIYPRIAVEDEDGDVCGEIVRPLLVIRRRELEQYLKDIGQTWREDLTNSDESLTRNRVRRLLVPLLEKEFNPAVAENLAELAEIARGEEDYWENEVAGWMGTTVHWAEPEWAREAANTRLVQIESKSPTSRAEGAREMGHPTELHSKEDLQTRIANARWLVMNASVSRLWFLGEPIAAQRRVVKAIGEHAGIPLECKHVEEILRLAAGDVGSGRELSLPLGWKVWREANENEIVFLTPDLRQLAQPQDYEYDLPVPGTVVVHEIGAEIEALVVVVPAVISTVIPADALAGYNPDQLLDAESLPGPLTVRNWRPGDRYWPAHSKSPKKVKELLQERHVALPERRLWPVVVSGDEIIWVRGFPPPARLQATSGREAIRIVERALVGKPAGNPTA